MVYHPEYCSSPVTGYGRYLLQPASSDNPDNSNFTDNSNHTNFTDNSNYTNFTDNPDYTNDTDNSS